MNRCTKCIRPETCRDIRFDNEGVCNFCRLFEKRWKKYIESPDEQYAKNQAKLKKAIDKEKRKNNKYQAILGISGGKDSSYALYLMREKYGINVLTLTMASDYYSNKARENVEKIVKIFDTDHIWTKGPSNELYAHSIRKTGRPCYPCVLCCHQPFAPLAREHDISILLTGYSPMTDGMDPEGTSPWFVRNFTQESDNTAIRREGNELYKGSYSYMIRTLSGRLKLFNLGMYFHWDDDTIRGFFKEKYNIEFDSEHSDCAWHDLAALCAIKKYGFSLNMSKYCKYIILGRMTREEALEKIENENSSLLNPKGRVKESIERALIKLNMTKEEVENSLGIDDTRFRKGLLNRLVDYYRTNFYA
jgi:hypothetical protein